MNSDKKTFELLKKKIQTEKENGEVEIEQKREELEEKLEIDLNQLNIEMLRAEVVKLQIEKEKIKMEHARNRKELITYIKLIGEDMKELFEDYLTLVEKAPSPVHVSRFRMCLIIEDLELKLDGMRNRLVKLRRMSPGNPEHLKSLENQISAMVFINSEFCKKLKKKHDGNNQELFQKFEKFFKILLEKIDLIEFPASICNVINELWKES